MDLPIEGEELVARVKEEAGSLGAAELGEIKRVNFVHVLVMDEPQAALVVECQLVQRRRRTDRTKEGGTLDPFPREQTVPAEERGCNSVAYVQLALPGRTGNIMSLTHRSIKTEDQRVLNRESRVLDSAESSPGARLAGPLSGVMMTGRPRCRTRLAHIALP